MAGVFHPGPYAKTEDGIEQTLAIDYFAPVLLTLGLLPLLRATPGARVVMMASEAEQFGKVQVVVAAGQGCNRQLRLCC